MIAAGFLAAGLAGVEASAEEDFSYPSGALGAASGGRGFDGAWQVLSGEATVEGEDLEVRLKKTGGKSAPGHLRLTGSASVARKLDHGVSSEGAGTTYFSFRYRLNGPPGRLIIWLGQNERAGGGNQVRLERKSGQSEFNLSLRIGGEWKKSTSEPEDPKPRGEVNPATEGLVVVRIQVEPGSATTASFWQFATGESPAEGTPVSSAAGGAMNGTFNWFAALAHEMPEASSVDLDDFRMGDAWSDVVGK